MELNALQRAEFLEVLWDFYARQGRDLPWRAPEPDGRFDPYKIMVSELMLQQTQVPRVTPKYYEFLQRFPTVQALAGADLGAVLRVWQGLGYNRRARYLHEAAKMVYSLNHFPDTLAGLVQLPGVGANTAGAILAYAYNQPALFVETNVRTVFLHHFFPGRTDVSDKEIVSLLAQVLLGEEGKEPVENPREFYWALMDYGSHLKATVGNPNQASRHYARQSPFNGSRRQVRGQVVRLLGGRARTPAELRQDIADERLDSVLGDLLAEGLIRFDGGAYSL